MNTFTPFNIQVFRYLAMKHGITIEHLLNPPLQSLTMKLGNSMEYLPHVPPLRYLTTHLRQVQLWIGHLFPTNTSISSIFKPQHEQATNMLCNSIFHKCFFFLKWPDV